MLPGRRCHLGRCVALRLEVALWLSLDAGKNRNSNLGIGEQSDNSEKRVENEGGKEG